jgi:hypothetical protein
MASWREIDQIRKSPERFRSLAAHLRDLPDERWWEYAERFLRDTAESPLVELNTRQAEYLLKLRDDKARHFVVRGGFSVSILINNCYLARFDLDEDEDIEFIEWLKNSGRAFVTGRQLGWFIRICKQLGELEPYA